MNNLQTPTGKEILVVDVPENAYNFEIEDEYNYLDYLQPIKSLGFMQRSADMKSGVPLEVQGQYTILGRLNEILQDDCEMLIELYDNNIMGEYKDYQFSSAIKYTARESLISFLTSKRIDISTNPLVILKK